MKKGVTRPPNEEGHKLHKEDVIGRLSVEEAHCKEAGTKHLNVEKLKLHKEGVTGEATDNAGDNTNNVSAPTEE